MFNTIRPKLTFFKVLGISLLFVIVALFFTFRSLAPLEHYLHNSVLQNSVTKTIYLIDTIDLDDTSHQALDLCSMLFNASVTPVPCTPFLKVVKV